MSKVHRGVRINPVIRHMWTQKSAKETWMHDLYRAQVLVNKTMLEAYKRGITKTYGIWLPKEDTYNISLLEDLYEGGDEILCVAAGTSRMRNSKSYTWFNKSTGDFHLFSNQSNVPMLSERAYTMFDLYLTLNYCNADAENMSWYNQQVEQGIYDPIGEMEDIDNINPYLNPFLRHMGIYILPYIARSWKDEYSLNLAKQLYELMLEIDEPAAKNVLTMLEMPMRWNCWRGVAIIDTPIFKTATDSVPYRERVIVDYDLDTMTHVDKFNIPGAAHGTAFPYRPKMKHEKKKQGTQTNKA